MGHHFLPKNLYLKPFKDSKDHPFIWVHEKGKEPQHRHWDRVATINELHTIKKNSGEKNNSLEEHLNQYELTLSQVVDRVIEDSGDKNLTPEEKQKFALFVGLMYVKTPRHFETNMDLADRLKSATSSALSGDRTLFNKLLEETKTDPESFYNKVNLEGVSQWIQNPEVYDHFPLLLLEQQAFAFAKLLYEKMRWSFLMPESELEFVTSDNPVSLCRITPTEMRDVYAIGEPDAELYFPISPRICFTAYHDTNIDRTKPSLTLSWEDRFVENINLRTAAFSQRFAYSHSMVDLQPYFNSKDLSSNSV